MGNKKCVLNPGDYVYCKGPNESYEVVKYLKKFEKNNPRELVGSSCGCYYGLSKKDSIDTEHRDSTIPIIKLTYENFKNLLLQVEKVAEIEDNYEIY